MKALGPGYLLAVATLSSVHAQRSPESLPAVTVSATQSSRQAAIQESVARGHSTTWQQPTRARDLVLSYYTLQTATRFQCNLRAVDSEHIL